MLNHRQIEIFSTIMERASLTEAARCLNLSQPAVSKALRSLEDHLGLALFVRSSLGLTPTDEARELHAEALRVLDGFDHLNAFAMNLHRLQHARLVIGVMPALSTSWLGRVIGSFSQEYPDVPLDLKSLDSSRIIKQVAQGELDVGIGQIQVEDPSVIKRKIFNLQLVCVVKKSHRLAEKDVITPADLIDETIVLLAGRDEFRKLLNGILFEQDVQVRSLLEASESHMVCSLVACAGGVGIVDTETAHSKIPTSVVAVPFLPVIQTPIFLFQNDRRRHNFAIQRLCAHMIKYHPYQHPLIGQA